MSKTYRVKVDTITRDADGQRPVRLLPLPGVQGDVAAECEADGWRRRDAAEPLVLEREFGTGRGTATATLDLRDGREGRLNVRASAQVDVIGESYDPLDRDSEGAQMAAEDAERRRGGYEQEADETVTAIVMDAEGPAVASVTAAVNRGYATALQRKAASMGVVESVERGTAANGSPELVIKVRV